MNNNQLFALFIIGFMAFSTVAFVLSATQDNPQDTGSAATPADNTPATKLSFSTQVDANVLEVFPSLKLAAVANEFNIAKIDSGIAQVEGITSVKSIFRQTEGTDGASIVTYYIADISFDSTKTSFDKVTAAIETATTNSLGEKGFFPNALIVVPQRLLLKNTDLNITKDYELKDNVIQSYLNSGTQKGDFILARVEISFSGEQPVGTMSSEIANLSGEAKEHSVSLSLPLVSVEPKLTFSADANYSDWMAIGENSLKESLLKINDINSVEQFSAGDIYFKMLLTITPPYSGTLENDLNAAILSIQDVTDIEFFNDSNNLDAIIGFKENSVLQPIKDAVAAKLSDLNVPRQNFYFTEPPVSVSGNLLLKGISAEKTANDAVQLFISKKFYPKVYQIGALTVQSLTDPDSKETFAVDSNSIEAAIFPVHKIGDTIFASVVFYSKRGVLLDAKAIEAINPVRIN